MTTTKHRNLLLSLLALALLLPATPAEAQSTPNRDLRQRVKDNLAKSRQARESSKFRTYANHERSGFRTLKRTPLKRRGITRGPNTVPDNYAVRGGGIQPDTVFDKSDRKMKRYIRRKAAVLRMKPNMKPWDKIDRIQKVVRMKVKHAGNELDATKNPNKYNKFNQKTKRAGKQAKLSTYLKMGSVVCREMAFLTQVALEDAGFESRLVRGDIMKNGKRIGGHAWNEVKIDGKWHMVDTTNPQFNKTDPQKALHQGTSNGWLWKRSSDRYVIGPARDMESSRNTLRGFWQ